FSFDAPGKALSIEIDPEYGTLRRLNSWEKPFTMGNTLNNKPIIILPSKSSADYDKTVLFVENLKENGYDVDYKSADILSDSDWKNRPMMLLGNPSNNPLMMKINSKLPNDIRLSGKKLTVEGKSYDIDKHTFSLNFAHPNNPELPATLIAFDSIDSEKSLSRLFHYMTASILLIDKKKGRRPLIMKELLPETSQNNSMRYVFPQK
ncbi:MAG: hypothetical protein KAH48_09540, partial [Chlorobi bacterium]|nr:hypothetical protein [Chlorobiota bacterium]